MKAAIAAMLTISLSFAPIGTICTGLSRADEQRADDGGPAQFLQHLGRDRRGVERRHDQDIRRAGQTAEGIDTHLVHIERDVGGHFAVIFEIHTAPVEDLHRFLHPLGAFATRMAEGGIGEHGDTRLVAKLARHMSRFFRDIRQFF